MANGGIIVLAEDDARMRRLYDDALSVAGFRVMAACDGIEALALIDKHRPRLIILDIMMPKLNGIETCKRARKNIGNGIPILFLSALDRFDILHGCLAAGGDDYLIKSDSIASLIARIRAWMRPDKRQGLIARRAKLLEGIRTDPDLMEADLDLDVPEPLADKESEYARFLALVHEALQHAGPQFGKAPEHKQYLAGYIAGIIEHSSAANGDSKDTFHSYLQAILEATGLFTPEDTGEIAVAYDELSKDLIFAKGKTRGGDDAILRQNKGAGHAMTGLADASLASAAAS